MIPIYICEDNENELKSLKELISGIIITEELEEQMEIVCATHDPLILLSCLKENIVPSVYFLDVDLGKNTLSGIELGVNIRILDPMAYIIMITTHSEAAPLTFKHKIGAKDFILKDDPGEVPKRVREHIIQAHDSMDDPELLKNKIVLLRKDYAPYTVYAKQIYCIEVVSSKQRKLMIHGRHTADMVTATLQDIKIQLDDSFFQCHKSYIINLSYVKEINAKEHIVKLANGREIPVSYRNVRLLENKYVDFLKKRT